MLNNVSVLPFTKQIDILFITLMISIGAELIAKGEPMPTDITVFDASNDIKSQNVTSVETNVGVNHFIWNVTENVFNLENNYTYDNSSADEEGYQLYDVPVYLVVLLSLLYGLISFTAVIGNSLVLWVVIVSRRMRTKTNFFIANLALADIIIAVFAIPFQFQAALLQRWNLPDFMCAFCPFVQVLSVNLSVFTMSAIALDRYRAIIYPFKAIRISTRQTSYTIVSIWLLSIALALPQEFDYRVIQLDGGEISKPFCAPVVLSVTFRTYYSIGLAIVQYVLPLLIISGAYAKMAANLWGASAPGNIEESRDENSLRNKKKAVKMLFVVVLIFALCWMPLQLYNFLQMITSINEYQYINIIWFCSHWLAMSNSCYNPFIYAIYSDKFQAEFRLRLHCLKKRSIADDQYCLDASEIEITRANFRTRLASTRISHANKQSVRKSNSIGTSRVADLKRGQQSRIGKNGHITTICNNVTTADGVITMEYPGNCSCSIEAFSNAP